LESIKITYNEINISIMKAFKGFTHHNHLYFTCLFVKNKQAKMCLRNHFCQPPLIGLFVYNQVLRAGCENEVSGETDRCVC